ncbi:MULTISPECIES: hypothetical protein [unclassified Streptomyces]|uniref:hypothetical protein n=1 Tax=unclassified Streptomyces TaxID=2593676 RepID=UPI0013A6DD38|nr:MULTISPECIES: hypothetical protein [unclassified Streptomyces]QZZ32023.1 hypothetical protein A7X85_42670 [Streptomyces sp. ST1015]
MGRGVHADDLVGVVVLAQVLHHRRARLGPAHPARDPQVRAPVGAARLDEQHADLIGSEPFGRHAALRQASAAT